MTGDASGVGRSPPLLIEWLSAISHLRFCTENRWYGGRHQNAGFANKACCWLRPMPPARSREVDASRLVVQRSPIAPVQLAHLLCTKVARGLVEESLGMRKGVLLMLPLLLPTKRRGMATRNCCREQPGSKIRVFTGRRSRGAAHRHIHVVLVLGCVVGGRSQI